jgi:hypothetical protein
MTYKTLKVAAADIDDVYKQLYKHHPTIVWDTNENGSITYFTDNKSCLIAATNLFAGFLTECIYGNIERVPTNFADLHSNYQETTQGEHTFEQFKAHLKFLQCWSGEYNDAILTITKVSDGYDVEYRHEGEQNSV